MKVYVLTTYYGYDLEVRGVTSSLEKAKEWSADFPSLPCSCPPGQRKEHHTNNDYHEFEMDDEDFRCGSYLHEEQTEEYAISDLVRLGLIDYLSVKEER